MKNFKSILAVALLIVAVLMPLAGFWVATLALPTAMKATIIGLLTLGGPEIVSIIAAALLGKEAYVALKAKLRSFFRKSAVQPSLKKSHTVGSLP